MSYSADNDYKKVEKQETKLQNLKNHIEAAIDRGGLYNDEEIAESLEADK